MRHRGRWPHAARQAFHSSRVLLLLAMVLLLHTRVVLIRPLRLPSRPSSTIRRKVPGSWSLHLLPLLVVMAVAMGRWTGCRRNVENLTST